MQLNLNDKKTIEKMALFFEIRKKEMNDEIKNVEFKTIEKNILDKGIVKILNWFGDEEFICSSARISTGNQDKEKTPEENEKLIRYLWRNKHTSPFEQSEWWFYIKLPIFCMRQLVRHRTAQLNEMSGRYRILPNEVYIPKESRIEGKGKTNKQGGEGTLSDETKQDFIVSLERRSQEAFIDYNFHDEAGISNEIARLGLPLNTYTEIYWKMNLRNLFHFLELRLHPHAQWEIQQYAKAMAEIIKERVPRAWKAFEDYTLNAVTFSMQERYALKNILKIAEEGNKDFSGIMADVMKDIPEKERVEFWSKL